MTSVFVVVWSDVIKRPSHDRRELSSTKVDNCFIYLYTLSLIFYWFTPFFLLRLFLMTFGLHFHSFMLFFICSYFILSSDLLFIYFSFYIFILFPSFFLIIMSLILFCFIFSFYKKTYFFLENKAKENI